MRYMVNYCFHAVGHGAFMTGVVMDKNAGTFKWVYDCGSKRSKAIKKAISFAATQPIWKEKIINMLVLSHFDDDHVNGLEDLINQHKRIDCLVLPFSEWQQRVREVVVGGVSASTAQLQLDPVMWLQSRGLASKVETLLLISGGTSESQDDLMPISPFTEPIFDNEQQGSENDGQRKLGMIDSSSHAGGLGVRIMSHGKPFRFNISPVEFMFYNAEVSSTDLGIVKLNSTGQLISRKSGLPLQVIRSHIERRIRRLGLDKPITGWRRDWRKKLKFCYERHFGSTGAAKNNISLVMYAAPIFDEKCMRPCCYYCCETSIFIGCTYPVLPSFKRRPAVLCTGDLRLDKTVISDMKRHFRMDRWGRIGITQVPHHGSRHSWAPGNAALLQPTCFVHCAPGTGVHPHPDVVKDLAGHTVFMADYNNSVVFGYRFHCPLW